MKVEIDIWESGSRAKGVKKLTCSLCLLCHLVPSYRTATTFIFYSNI